MFTYENFTYRAFIDHVIKKLRLDKSEPEILDKIEKEISRTLGQRILHSIMSSMTEADMKKFELLRDASIDVTDFEALYAIVDQVPALHEVLIHNVNELEAELTQDVAMLDEVLEEKKQKQTK